MSWRKLGLMWLALSVSGIGLFPGTGAAQNNPIVTENQQPGTSQWRIPWGSAGNDTAGQIKGYASATSVNKGENITFYISVNPAQTYTIDVYRMGWYQGLGGRLMQHIGPLNGSQQPTCPTNGVTGMIECRWAPAFTLATQTSWTSGIYLALLTNAQTYRNYIVFVVRDDNRVAPLLYQQPVTTYQAYNNYPYNNQTGKSLYAFNSFGATTVTGGRSAAKVSFDRPYLGDGTGADYSQTFLQWEVFFIRWMEKSGYDVTYSTDIDTHTNGQRLLNYRGLIVAGHDEYWSKPMYDAVVAARDAGVNLAFFGANVAGWQIRFEPSSSGVPNRVMVCYKAASIDPVTDVSLKTVEWRSTVLNRPEQTLVGVQFSTGVPWNQGYPPYVVTNSGNWVYAGTGFRDGDSVPGILGYEADSLFSNYPRPNALTGTYTLLSNSPAGIGYPIANSSVYQAQSGAWVFAAGTLNWTWALDNYNGLNLADARIQRTTANVLNRFLGPDFSMSTSVSSRTVAPGGSTSYGVTISAASGFTGAVTLSVSGLPSGVTAGFAPNPTTASSNLSVTVSAGTPPGTYPLGITGTSGNLTHATTVSLVVSALPDFTLSVSPSSGSVGPSGSTSYSVTIGPTAGFTGPVTLNVSGLPSGTNATFSSNPATLSSTLSVTTSASTPLGTYTVTITGVSANLTHSAAVAITVAASSDSDFSNKVLNPGFENGLSPWTTYGAATLVSSPVSSGQSAAQVQANSGVFQQISGLLPNTRYILTAQARIEFAGSTVWVGVKNHGGPEQFQGIGSTSYTPANVTFTTGPSSTSALVYLWLNAGVSGRAWGDDYAVAPATSGSYALVASPSSVASGGTITANWTALAVQTATTDRIGLYAIGTPNTSPLSSASTGGATSGSLNFTAPATTGTYELRYVDSSNTALATSNAITVTASPGSSNKVLNPGFENGLSPWTTYGTATLVNSPVSSGQYAAQLQANSGVFQQVNGLLPNTTYVLTARVKVEVAGSTIWAGVKNYGGPEQFQGIVSTDYTTPNVTFTTGPSSTSALIYLWVNAGVSGRAWGDDYFVLGP